MQHICSFILITIILAPCYCQDVNLPESHIAKSVGNEECWGYERNCKQIAYPTCLEGKDPYTGRDLKEIFYEQADFGYLKKILDEMISFCESDQDGKSRLDCSKNMLFCRAKNLFLDLKRVQDEKRSLKYQMDVLRSGEIGGCCDEYHQKKLLQNGDFMSPLQSWMPELRFFANQSGFEHSSFEQNCDVYIEKRTFIMKLDATVNMYHHFCDFFNLYASLHLNSQFDKDSWSQDVNILIWENQRYDSNFGSVFKAFTSNRILDLNSFGKRQVCFRDAVFPLLPRMVFGLFYNTPIEENCSNSGLFKAFSEFLNHRLQIPDATFTDSRKIRVTIISRQTRHRRILNEEQLVEALEATGKYVVTVAKFTHATNFLTQMSIVRKTDILIGMHGSGLTHCLFLKDWAVLFELYHCEDPSCYSDLARLRGIQYITWTKHQLLTPEDGDLNLQDPRRSHAKFTNYYFDKNEFLSKVEKARNLVLANKQFQKLDVAKKIPKEEL